MLKMLKIANNHRDSEKKKEFMLKFRQTNHMVATKIKTTTYIRKSM